MIRKSIGTLAGIAALIVSASFANAAPPVPGSGKSGGNFVNTSDTQQATVVIQYIDSTGAVAGTKDVILSPHAAVDLSPSTVPALPSSWSGSIIASSDQDIAGQTYINYSSNSGSPYTNLTTGQQADNLASADYVPTYAPATDLFFPNVGRRDDEAGYLYVQNTNSPGGASAQVYFNFYDRDGNSYPTSRIIRNVPAGAQTVVNMFTDTSNANLGNSTPGFLGSVYVTSTQPIAGAAVHTWSYGLYGYTARPASSASTLVAFPKVVRRCRAVDGCVDARLIGDLGFMDSTGIVCANTSSSIAATVNVTITNRAGTVESTFSDSIPALSSRGYNTRYGGNMPTPARDLIVGADQGGSTMTPYFLGSAMVGSTQPIVCIAKQLYDLDVSAQIGGQPATTLREAAGYDGINVSAASNKIYAPVVWRQLSVAPCGTGGWNYSGTSILNAVGSTGTVRVTYYDTNGNPVLNYLDPNTLGGFTPRGYNTKFDSGIPSSVSSNLGTSFNGTAVISSTVPILAIQESWQNCPGVMTDSDISELNK
jgi:hypothetical protein